MLKLPLEYISSSEEETYALAEELAQGFSGSEVLLLTGELGAGKTVFTKGLAAGLGLSNVNQVCSPSYTLINVYYDTATIVHIDLYRLENKTEIDDLGWEDYLGNAVIIIEWAEKMTYSAPAICVAIEVAENEQRIIKIACQ